MVLCEPGRTARTAEVGTGLEDLQKAVGGRIEAVYPFDEPVCLVCNEEGKFNGMGPNRALYDGDGQLRDIVFGPFFVCGCRGPAFGSLTEDQLERYGRLFRLPERFTRLKGRILVQPYAPVPARGPER